MAKATGSTKAQKSYDNSNSDDLKRANSDEAATKRKAADAKSESTELAVVNGLDTEPQAKIEPVEQSPMRVDESSASDIPDDKLSELGSDFGHQIRLTADAFESAGRKWMSLADRIVSSNEELKRLRAVEADHTRLTKLYDGERAMTESLQGELREVKAAEAAALEKAAKFEEICEQIKERAFEIHTSLQQTRANEQKVQADLATAQSELTELRRVAQDESAGRLSAEEQNKRLREDVAKLEADDAAARERMARIVEDNKLMAGQVPHLLADRDNWQKQFSASERENGRMLAQRKVADERINGLEDEIRTLRSDLASLTSAHSAKAIPSAHSAKAIPSAHSGKAIPSSLAKAGPEVAPTPSPVEIEEEIDDLDLAASLDRAFSTEDPLAEPDKAGKLPH